MNPPEFPLNSPRPPFGSGFTAFTDGGDPYGPSGRSSPAPGTPPDGPRVHVGSTSSAHWYAFAHPDLPETELHGAPTGLPRPDRDVSAQWNAHWDRTDTSARGPLERALSDFAGGPGFRSLTDLPALRDHCRALWPLFRDWLPGSARPPARSAVILGARRVDEASRTQALGAGDARHPDRIEVAALRSERVLFDVPGFAVVSVGFVGSDAFVDWLAAFTRRAG